MKMNQFLYVKRRCINFLALALSVIAMIVGLFWLLWILCTLFKDGSQGLSFTVFTRVTSSPGSHGGLVNAIVGSLLMTSIAVAIGAPLGILVGTYLSEFGKKNTFAKLVRFVNDVLLSAPSIIIGLFIYQIYVMNTQHFSGWAGAFALAILVFPVVVRTTEDMFVLAPNTLREAAAALGTPQWKIILHVIFRVSRTGILTGILLAFARICGETAPLLFTALNNQFWSLNLNQPLANLPMVIYQYAMSPYDDWHQLAWTGALIITLWALSLNILVRVVFKQKLHLR